MATEVDWNSLGGKDTKNRRNDYISFSSDVTVRIRPVGKAVEFVKFFVKTPNGNRSVVVDMDEQKEAAKLLSNHLGQEVKPQHRFAINVIDREDEKVKILEGGKSIFDAFGEWARESDTHPGSPEGGDWSIRPTGDGLARRYNTTFLKPTVVSKEEREKIRFVVSERPLADLYKAVPLDSLIKTIFGKDDPDSQGDNESNEEIDW